MATEELVVRASLRDELSGPVRRLRDNVEDLGSTSQQTGRRMQTAADGTRYWTDQAGRARAENGRFLSSTERAAAGIKEQARETRQAASDTDRLGGALFRAGGLAKGALGSVARYTALAATGIAGATAGAVGFGLKTAASMETARIGFTTMLGSAEKAQAFLGDLQKFAATTPFEFPELQTAASSLISAGISADKVIPIMTSLGNATAGMGTGSEGVQRATVALQQMSAAGRITGEDLNQLRDAGIPVFDLLAAATGKSVKQVAELAQKGKLGARELEQLMGALESGKGLERFNGLMEAQSKTLSGVFSTMKDTIAMGLADTVQPLVPILTELAPRVAEGIGRALGTITTGAGAVIARLQTQVPNLWGAILDADAEGIGEVLDNILGNTGRWVAPIREVSEAVIGVVRVARDSFLPVVRDVAGVVGPVLGVALLAAANALEFLGNNTTAVRVVLYGVVGALGLLLTTMAIMRVASVTTAAVTFLYTLATQGLTVALGGQAAVQSKSLATQAAVRLATIASTAVTWAWTAATWAASASATALGVAWRFLTGPIGLVITAVTLLVGALVYLWKNNEGFRNAILGAWEAIKAGVGAAVDWLRGALARVAETWRTTWESVRAIASAVWTGIRVALAIFLTALLTPFVLFGNAVAAAWDWLWGKIGATVTTAWNAVVAFVRQGLAFYFAIWRAAWDLVSSTLGSAWDWISGKVRAAWDWIAGYIGAGLNFYLSLWRAAWALVTGVLRSAWDAITARVGQAWDWIVGRFRSAQVVVSTVWGALWDGARSKVSAVMDGIHEKIATVLGAIQTGIGTARDAIGRLWDGIRAKMRDPVNWVIRNVWNNGIRRAWNMVAGLVGLRALDVAPEVALASGGRVPGATDLRGRDDVLARLTRGEFVVNARDTQRNQAALEYANAGGTVVPAYAHGGRVHVEGEPRPNLLDRATGAVGGAARAVGNAAAAVGSAAVGAARSAADIAADVATRGARAVAASVIDPVVGLLGRTLAGNPMGDLVVGVGRKVAGAVLDLINRKDSERTAAAGAAAPPGGGGSITGLHPEFVKMWNAYNAATGNRYRIGSGFRSSAQQAALYRRWVNRVPGQAQAAPPGRSNHEFGVAIDHTPHSNARDRALAGRFGLRYPMSFEPWHIEPAWANSFRASARRRFATGGLVGSVGRDVSLYDSGGWLRQGQAAVSTLPRARREAVMPEDVMVGAIRRELGATGGGGVLVEAGAIVVQITEPGAGPLEIAEAVRLGIEQWERDRRER